jgi:gamma-glutamylcyclotransferase (GGCT)/AIG2-like uncharacterized protein YtfP
LVVGDRLLVFLCVLYAFVVDWLNMAENSETLFVYGTLHDPQVQLLLIGRRLNSTPDVLLKYRRDTELFPPYPVAVVDADGYINGWVLRVNSEELERLDNYEGENYIRVRVSLASGLQAWVYTASPILLAKVAQDNDEDEI